MVFHPLLCRVQLKAQRGNGTGLLLSRRCDLWLDVRFLAALALQSDLLWVPPKALPKDAPELVFL